MHMGTHRYSLKCEMLLPLWPAGLVLSETPRGSCLSLSMDFDYIVFEKPCGSWETRVCA